MSEIIWKSFRDGLILGFVGGVIICAGIAIILFLAQYS